MEFFKNLLVYISELFNQKKSVAIRVVDQQKTSEKKQGIKKGNRDFNQMRWK